MESKLNPMPLPTVSVLMPIFGEGTWLRQALESVEEQTFRDWELIACLDGPNPRASEIIDEFDGRFRCIQLAKRSGISAARNCAFSASKGEFIAMLDSDDYWRPDHLERQVRELSTDKELVLVYCRAREVSASGQVLGSRGVEGIGDARLRLLLSNIIPQSSAVFRRGILTGKTGPWTSETDGVEDYDLWLRIARHGLVRATAGSIGYRVHPLQQSLTKISRGALFRLERNRLALARDMGPNAFFHFVAGNFWSLSKTIAPHFLRSRRGQAN